MLNEILVTGVILGSVLLIVTALLRGRESPLEGYAGGGRTDTDSVLWFGEVCRSILNTNSLRFVAANAPAEVVTSFGTQQQRLARFSLQAASAVLVQQLAQDIGSRRDFSRSLQSSVSKLRYAFLLALCTTGRAGLGILRGLSSGFPQRIQISVAAKILAKVGTFLIDSNGKDKPMVRDLGDQWVWCRNPRSANGSQGAVTQDILRALGASLPNDLSRLIFLATLRDNNSGHYYHPEVARRFSEKIADRAMLAGHRQIYEHVVALTLEDLTDQLDAYMATVRVPKQRLIESWIKLPAYRATIPMDTDPISAEIFFMKVGVAVAILEARLPSRVQ